MASPSRETFTFLPGLGLEVRGDGRAIAHFRAEYGAALDDGDTKPDVVITFAKTSADRAGFEGGYRSLRWRVTLDPSEDDQLRATIDLEGAPRSFGLSLLQGYVVEPLLALPAPQAEHVLLPAAAVAAEDGTLLLVGRSRSGKSSLVARAAATGTAVLGDDHVLVGPEGCRAFPRRLRLYPDIAETAPAAWAALEPGARVLLRVLGVVRKVSGGRVAPPVRIPVQRLGAVVPGPLPLARVVLIERRNVSRLITEPLSRDELVAAAAQILREQRQALDRLATPPWEERVTRVRRQEESLLREAFARVGGLRRLVVPSELPAGESVGAIASELAVG